MVRQATPIAGAIVASFGFVLAIVGTIVRYSHGKPTDYSALVGALGCVFFFIVVFRRRGEK